MRQITKAVAYYRVSTARQAKSGLGLEAQREAVRTFLQRGWPPIAEFTEQESGKDSVNRPQLQKALEHCKLTGATLVIAKLDRLSRNAAFLMTLRDRGVSFVAVDMPEANTLTIGLMAVMAQHEREAISARTKAALQAAKRRGKVLGTPANLTRKAARKGRLMGQQAAQLRATEYRQRLAPVLADMRARGLSLRGMVQELEANQIETLNGGQWYATTVRNLLGAIA